ncbi:Small nuclear ribonucleoprotein Sm D2 [Diplonema papillatum]|nr:Small nuclear ribonucleoprotein Sm D2 [Diplonema papillatum]WGM49931.1 SmD2 [Diplonema papillatum]|eukprot:gene10758-16570_t
MPAKRPREEEEDDKDKKEEESFENGPMSILREAIQLEKEVLVNCRNNKKLLGKVRGFDRHMNLVMESVEEMWTEIPKVASGTKPKPVNKFRYINKLFLRGDNVILVVKNPQLLVGK